MAIIKTKDFKLRPLSIKDLEGYWEVMQDPETIKNFNSVPANKAEAKKEIIEIIKRDNEKGAETFTIEIDGKYAGNIQLQPQDWDKKKKEGRMHIWIHPAFRGKGIATNVFIEVIKYGKKKYNRVYAQCKSINTGLMHILDKLGFKLVKEFTNEEGVKKKLFVKEF